MSSVELLQITNIHNKYLPTFMYLPGTTLLLRASARELPAKNLWLLPIYIYEHVPYEQNLPFQMYIYLSTIVNVFRQMG